MSGLFENIEDFDKDEQQRIDDDFHNKNINDSFFILPSGTLPSSLFSKESGILPWFDFSRDDLSITDLESNTFLMEGKFKHLSDNRHRYSLIVYVDEIKIDSFLISLENDDRAKISISSSSVEYLKIIKKHYYDKYHCYIVDVFDEKVVEILNPNENK